MKKLISNILMTGLIAFYATGMVFLASNLPKLASELMEEK